MNMPVRNGLSILFCGAVVCLIGMLSGCGGGDSSSSPPPVAVQQTSIATGDFNADGRLDLAVCASRTFGTTPIAGEVQIYLQDPLRPGFFIRQRDIAVGVDPAQIAAGDLNGDGLVDLATANTGSDSVSILFNNPAGPGNFLQIVEFPTGPGPLSVAIGDLNRDLAADMAIAVADGVDILFQNPALPGAFIFASPAELGVLDGTFSVAVGDLDGDGIADIAAAGFNDVQVFFQVPLVAGAFFAASVFDAGISPNSVAIADIDQDGLLDIAVANLGLDADGSGASISILIQDPVIAGNFLAVRNTAVSNGAQNLAAADLNGDGFPDIAVASVVLNSPNPGIISIFLQDPVTGALNLSAAKPNGFTPLFVATGDLNVDGLPDIAIQDGPSILFQDPLQPGTFFDEVLLQ